MKRPDPSRHGGPATALRCLLACALAAGVAGAAFAAASASSPASAAAGTASAAATSASTAAAASAAGVAEAAKQPRAPNAASQPGTAAAASGGTRPVAPVSAAVCDARAEEQDIVAALTTLPPTHQVKLASRYSSLPLGKPAQVLALVPFEPDSRTVVIMEPRVPPADTAVPAVIRGGGTWSEETVKNSTDFRPSERPERKTLVHFVPDMPRQGKWYDLPARWNDVRVHVVSCTSDEKLRYFGQVDATVTDVWTCRMLAVALCAAFYLLAAWATFHVRRSQRVHATADEAARHGAGGGTQYASFAAHLNPVVLAAGSNGRGNATKLQIAFFSLLVFGLVSYLWMSTGYLSDLSHTVLLLMGISGLGATVATATEVSKTRLDFDNWAWLINRGWLPRGGVAEVNHAQWSDIFTSDGEFDVYRFQMITFSVLVGLALLHAASEPSELSTFKIPDALLGVLGLSQVVYVAGKLVAPPAIAQLNAQITRLRGMETDLQAALNRRDAGAETALPLDRAELKVRVGDAYDKYMETWETTRTMFESTLSRSVTATAEGYRPPFPYLSDPVEVLSVLESRFVAVDRRLRAGETKLSELRDTAAADAFRADIDAARTDYEAAVVRARQAVKAFASASDSARTPESAAVRDAAAGTRTTLEASARQSLEAVRRCIERLDAAARRLEAAG